MNCFNPNKHDDLSYTIEDSGEILPPKKPSKRKNQIQYPWTGEGNDGKSKNFLLHCIGTRGDVQPLVVIAQRLMKDGHKCRIGCDPQFKDLVEGQGVEFYAITGYDPVFIMKEIPLDDAAIIDLIPMRAKLVERFREVNECTWNAATQPSPDGTPFTAEVMICSIYQQCALAIAEKLQIPMFLYSAFPVLETEEFRNPVGIIMSAKTTGHKIPNKMSWGLNDKLTSMGFQRAMRDFRTQHGLPKTKESVTLQSTCNELRIPSFGIWSPNILHKPADWHENALVLGALKGHGGLGDTLPAELEAYLQESEQQPVFFGFGSMANQKSLQNVWTQIDQVCRNMEIKRAIFHVSPQDKKFIKQPLPEGVFLLDKPVNHAALFKRCSAVVHHGGAGTVQTGLSSGKPTGILSFACDQPFWGEVVQSGNMGATCTARSCSVSKLTKIMNVLFDEDTKTKCEDIAYRLSVEPDATEAFVHELYARLPKTGMKIDYRAMLKDDKWKKTWDSSHRLGVAPPLYRKHYTNIHKSKHWLLDKLSGFGA